MKKYFFFIFFLSSCISPQVSVNKNADFSKIKRVAVLEFKGPNGQVASDIFTITLLKHGANIVERQQIDTILKELDLSHGDLINPQTRKKLGNLLSVDAIITGTVLDYKPQKKYLMKDTNKAFNTFSEIEGKNVFIQSFDPTTDTYLIETTLQIGLSIKMIDIETGSIMWAGHLTYEGLDLSTTLATISEYLVRSLSKNWQLIAPKK